eukprot:IDg17541t1
MAASRSARHAGNGQPLPRTEAALLEDAIAPRCARMSRARTRNLDGIADVKCASAVAYTASSLLLYPTFIVHARHCRPRLSAGEHSRAASYRPSAWCCVAGGEKHKMCKYMIAVLSRSRRSYSAEFSATFVRFGILPMCRNRSCRQPRLPYCAPAVAVLSLCTSLLRLASRRLLSRRFRSGIASELGQFTCGKKILIAAFKCHPPSGSGQHPDSAKIY